MKCTVAQRFFYVFFFLIKHSLTGLSGLELFHEIYFLFSVNEYVLLCHLEDLFFIGYLDQYHTTRCDTI